MRPDTVPFVAKREDTAPRGERVDVASREPLTDQLVRILRAQIDAGTLTGRMPSESALEKYHDVSRVTVRRALERLQADHKIYPLPGRGWFVGWREP